MYRKDSIAIGEWIKNSNKALLVTGARQIGKTWLIRDEIEKSGYTKFEVNFIDQPDMVSYLNAEMSAEDFLIKLKMIMPEDCKSHETVVFFDEIQKCPEIVTKIKFLVDEGSFKYVMSGSLLGVELKGIASAPVGYLTVLKMYPMDFEEFMMANNVSVTTLDMLNEKFKNASPVDEFVHQKLLSMFFVYLIVGGMPEAVKSFVETNSYIDASLVQTSIIDNYTADMAKYASNTETVKIRACYNSIPAQLAKDNKKFQYKVVQKGGSASIFGASLDWLKQAGVILECQRIDQGMHPLAVYADQTAFKVYMSDVGLLVNKSKMSVNTIISGEANIFMGAVTENYVAQQFAAKCYPLYYWSTANSQAELDFVLQKEDEIYAVEVKKGEHVRSRSLSVFSQKFSPNVAIRLSQKNFGKTEDVISIPLYAAFLI